MESAQEWAARIKAELKAQEAAKTPEQKAADEARHREWLANLPVLPHHPLKPGEVEVWFIKRKPKQGGGGPAPRPRRPRGQWG
jgi:hypothetical protein